MIQLPNVLSARRPHLFLALLLGVATLLFVHNALDPSGLGVPQQPVVLEGGRFHDKDPKVVQRTEKMASFCSAEDPFEKEFGRTNLRLSRGYEGSHHRVRQFLHKILRGEQITMSTIGGSVTAGHQVWGNEVWFVKLVEWMQKYIPGDVHLEYVNGAAPATGSDYFSYCFPLHIPNESDLIIVELAVNDEGIPEHVENMENLLRGLMDLPHKPAVILVEAIAFSNGGMAGGGGRMHLPIAEYFDVPVISQRLPLSTHFARHPELIRPYFSQDYWGNPDMRHINSHGHRDLGKLIASFLKDVSCTMLAEPQFTVPPSNAVVVKDLFEELTPVDSAEAAKAQDARLVEEQLQWPEQTRVWRKNPDKEETVGQLMPGIWMSPSELGLIPRLRALDGWNPNLDSVVPSFRPMCFSTRSKEPQFNLTPTTNEGWEYWAQPEHPDKLYLLARQPGARVSFELETIVGTIKMYSLRSKTFGLGTVECWIGDARDRAVKVVGWWDNGNANIGRFETLGENIPPGRHTVTCELLEETSDEGGGHEFRMISIMSI